MSRRTAAEPARDGRPDTQGQDAARSLHQHQDEQEWESAAPYGM